MITVVAAAGVVLGSLAVGIFDNRILLLPGVGEHLAALNTLLRPLLQHRWAVKVADLNHLDELERFLFGVERSSLKPVRMPLAELQDNHSGLRSRPEPR